MEIFVAELVGTAILVLLGDGVVANVVLARTKGHGSGWIVITTGWALGVAMAVYAVGRISGAHINPAVTLGLASIGSLAWALVPVYLAGQRCRLTRQQPLTRRILAWLANHHKRVMLIAWIPRYETGLPKSAGVAARRVAGPLRRRRRGRW